MNPQDPQTTSARPTEPDLCNALEGETKIPDPK